MDKTEFLTIFPTFENLDAVKRTLPSVIEETLKRDAKLIVHDSSVSGRDEKWSYLSDLSMRFDFFLILSTNMSMAHARNMCLQLGQELYAPDYICMLEDDHGFRDGVIPTLVRAMRQFYGKMSPNGLRFGMFSACAEHTNAQHERMAGGEIYPSLDNVPFAMGGFNSCFRCAPTSHWNNVLKGYDTDGYLISEYQTSRARWRNYHKGFTYMIVEDGRLVFTVSSPGRGVTSKEKLMFWDNEYCADDPRARFRK